MHTKKLVIGILAHVDSGKTTLAESMLFLSGNIRRFGRVDHKDAFLDTYELERMRGITIFSKQAQLKLGDKDICLLDTPGHVDFSAEMERTLQVLDYAILVINGSDGVQGHTQTLWKLLKRYAIPVFLFINKMDQPETNKDKLLATIQKQLDFRCIEFNCNKDREEYYESIAMCDEMLMDLYLDNYEFSDCDIKNSILERKIFPCYFGSALKQEGVNELLDGIERYMESPLYPIEFAARVFKIIRDEQNNRLTYLKITGGCLKNKLTISDNKNQWSEKINQIRIYSGSQYTLVNEAVAGTICAVTGLTQTYSGEGLGIESAPEIPVLEPVLTYQLIFPAENSVYDMYTKLSLLEEEEPELHMVWNKILNEIHVQVMGEVQIEILKSIIKERFGITVEFDAGNIVYKETIESSTMGIGHFEPLRHYAEVHLMIEPLERGSGLEFATNCSEDILDKNWQRLILTHLEEKKHRGVLTGSEITDLKISLIAGRAHQKHTEGGDFRQATYRAVRQGLKSAKSILLEPIYQFILEIPQDMIGHAISDIQKRCGEFDPPVINGTIAIITGKAPVVTMQDYQKEVISYSHGCGKFFCSLKGYEVCHNTDAVIEALNYNSEKDMDNPTGSIFCAHGAGYYVKWDNVPKYAHIDNELCKKNVVREDFNTNSKKNYANFADGVIDQKEIDEIFTRTFGNIKQKRNHWGKAIKAEVDNNYQGQKQIEYIEQKEYLLVDGYNIIFAWDELKKLAKVNIDSARDKLIDIMCNYQGYKQCELILVFDAYKVLGGQRTVLDYPNIHIVYTKEAETADQYIEKVTHKIGGKYKVTVATSDGLEQLIVWGQGARRLSAADFWEEVCNTNEAIRNHLNNVNGRTQVCQMKQYLFDNVSNDVAQIIKNIQTTE